MRFKSFKIGKSKEKPEEDAVEAGDTAAPQEAETEEQLNNKADDLEKTAQLSEGTSDAANDSEEDKDAPPQPHGPLSELSVEPEDDLTYDDTDVGAPAEDTGEAAKVVEVGAAAAPPAEAEKETKQEDESDSLSNLFSNDEEEVNPLASLINALPDVTAQELIDDLHEINEIIREWQRG